MAYTTIPASSGGTATALAATSAGTIAVADAATNTVTTLLTLTHTTSGTAAASFGAAEVIQLESAGGTTRNASIWRTTWTTATDAAEVAAVGLGLMSAGSTPAAGSEQFRWTPGQYFIPSGTGAAPSLAVGQADAGIFSPGSNAVGIAAAGGMTAKVTNANMLVTGGLIASSLGPGNTDGLGGAGATMIHKDGNGTEIFRVAQNTIQLAAASEAANNAQTVTVGNVGPGSAGISIQAWMSVKNSSGTVRYIPLFG